MSSAKEELLSRARRIFIRGLRRHVFIGAYDDERNRRQTVTFDIDVWVGWEHSSGAQLTEVYDYTAIPQAVDAVIAQGHIDLQETLVDAIAAKLLCDPRLLAVQIASCKREAMLDAEGVGVEVFRCQNSVKNPS